MSAPTKTVWNSIWPYLLLCGLCTIFLADVLFAGKILFLRDVFAGVVPTWTLIHDAIHAGRLPLWNPFVACGVPLAGDPYTQLFYPPFWLFIFFPTEIALRLFLWFHLILAAISVYALCRHWRLDVSASLLAGISFALSTFSVGWLEFTTGLACLSLAALSFIIVDTLFERCRCFLHAGMPKLAKSVACPLAALGVLFFLQIVAAGEWFYYCSLFVGAFCLWQFFALRTLRANLLACVCIGIAVALGLTLAAPQVLPTLGAMQMSIRAGEVDAALHMTSAHPRHWLSFILPFFYGKPGYPDSYWAPTIYEFVNGTCYIGILRC